MHAIKIEPSIQLPPLPWYVAQVDTGRENDFVDDMRKVGIEAISPYTEKKVRMFNHTRKKKRAILPGYAFIGASGTWNYDEIQSHPFFHDLLRCGDGFALVHDYVVESVRLGAAILRGEVTVLRADTVGAKRVAEAKQVIDRMLGLAPGDRIRHLLNHSASASAN